MELKLSNGDYVPDGAGGFVRCEGMRGILMTALFRLTCRRGAFPFLPELGSRLYTLAGEKPSARDALARQYCAEALEDLDGLEVVDTTLRELSDGLLALTVTLAYDGESETLEVEL
jgi:phage gp46-like protein